MALRLPDKWLWDFWLAHDDLTYLLFSTFAWTTAAQWTQRTEQPPVTGTHYLVADDPLGPFHFSTDDSLVGDSIGSFYGGRLVQGPDDT